MVCGDFGCYFLKSLIAIFVENRITIIIENWFPLWDFLGHSCLLIGIENFHNSFWLTIAAVHKLVFVLIKLWSFTCKEVWFGIICKFELRESFKSWLFCTKEDSLVAATETVVLRCLVIIGHLVSTLVICLSIIDNQVRAGLWYLIVGIGYWVV